MVLAELWWSISRAIHRMSSATVIDEKVLNECLDEISRALLQSDIQFKLVGDFLSNTRKNIVNLEDHPHQKKRKIIQQAILKGLCEIFDTGKPPLTPIKGKANVIMFAGLQGSGTTTACTKFAHYYMRKGWRSALLCADTITAGAFDQLKHKAWKENIPFFGSYMESNTVKIAVAGVERFKKEHRDVFIVDTGGRHEQEAALFDEMRQVAEAIKPDLVIFVMDSSIGQAAFDQAQAFKQSAKAGAVILTKMDGHSKGAGALSAVAATKIPVIFIGTGEHIDEFEVFDVKSFVSRLIDIGYLSGYNVKIRRVGPTVQQSRIWQKVPEGNFTLRVMYAELQNMLEMGSISQVHAIFPEFNAELMRKDREKESQEKIKRYMALMNSMTDEELDSSTLTLMIDSRIMRIAATSGYLVREVIEMFEEYERWTKMWSKVKKILAMVN